MFYAATEAIYISLTENELKFMLGPTLRAGLARLIEPVATRKANLMSLPERKQGSISPNSIRLGLNT